MTHITLQNILKTYLWHAAKASPKIMKRLPHAQKSLKIIPKCVQRAPKGTQKQILGRPWALTDSIYRKVLPCLAKIDHQAPKVLPKLSQSVPKGLKKLLKSLPKDILNRPRNRTCHLDPLFLENWCPSAAKPSLLEIRQPSDPAQFSTHPSLGLPPLMRTSLREAILVQRPSRTQRVQALPVIRQPL